MNVSNEILNMYPDVLNVKQLMEILQVKKSFVYKLLCTNDKEDLKKKIRAFRCGKNYRILKSSLIEYLKNQ